MVSLRIALIALLGATSSSATGNNQPSLRRGDDGSGQEHHERSLITGGKAQDDSVKSFAFIVTYDASDGIFKQCGGTLVKDDVVLTAAHCVEGRKRPVLVALGAKHAKMVKPSGNLNAGKSITDIGKGWKLEHDAEHISTVTNKKGNWVLHEEYGGGGFLNDIALIKLDNAADTSWFNKNAKIQKLGNNPGNKDAVYAIGHGGTLFKEPKENPFSDELKIGKMVVDGAGTACSSVSTTFDNTRMICAVNTKVKAIYDGEKSFNTNADLEEYVGDYGNPCSGDSGGPLYSKKQGWGRGVDLEDQVGITSYGNNPGCGYWVAFTRVRYYKDWIEEESKSLSG